MIVVWMLGIVTGLGLAIWSSRLALDAASALGRGLGISPFVLGVTVVAIGTDLPEIANSIVSSSTGHGDVNVGDSIGSVVTQATLVLGILMMAGRLRGSRRSVVTTGALTVLALLTGAVLFADEHFARIDGALLLATWLAGTLIIRWPTRRRHHEDVPERSGKIPILGLRTVAFLALVGVGATIAVQSFTTVAADLGAPEYLLSFFLLALGTSLPELFVDFRALRRGEAELALGAVLGSSFVDATLSPGIGPLLFPTELSAGLARGNLIAAATIAIVTAVLARDASHRWQTGIVLVLLYLALYPALLT